MKLKSAQRSPLLGKIYFSLAMCALILVGGILFIAAQEIVTNSKGTNPFSQLFNFGYWDFQSELFSALSMIYGTISVSFIALVFSVPVGIFSAVLLSEYTGRKLRVVGKLIIETIASVPSVVYGLIGVIYVVPFMNSLLFPIDGYGDSLLTGGIILSFMILPTIVSLTDDALRCVSKDLRMNALALGISREKTISHIVLPSALPGIYGATFLALGRALGETIAVFLVIGRSDQLFHGGFEGFLTSLIRPGQTLTTKLGGPELPIAAADPLHWSHLISLVIILWVVVIFTSYIGRKLQNVSTDVESKPARLLL